MAQGKAFLIHLLLALLLAAAPLAHARTLKIATLAPDGTSWMKEMRQGAEEIAEKTNGRVKLKFYPGGVMGNDKSVLRKIRIGQLHGGAFAGGGLAEVYKDTQIYSLPFTFRSYGEVDYVRERMDPLIRQGLAKNGMVVLGISEGGFAYMMCTRPLRTVDDLKGQKVWLPEGDVIIEVMFQKAGVTPVPLPVADVYTGLQTGLLDTVGSSPMASIAFQWHTRITHLTDVPLLYIIGILAVDQKAFRRLSAEDQATVQAVMKGVFKRLDRQNREDNQEARQALKAQGMEFVGPEPGELKRWHEIAEGSLGPLGEQGIYSVEMLTTLQGHLEDYRRAQGGDAAP